MDPNELVRTDFKSPDLSTQAGSTLNTPFSHANSYYLGKDNAQPELHSTFNYAANPTHQELLQPNSGVSRGFELKSYGANVDMHDEAEENIDEDQAISLQIGDS